MRTFLALMLASTAFFVSCDNEPMEKEVNPFLGTWEYTGNEIVKWVFTDKNITSYYDDDLKIFWTGTYTYSNTQIIIILNPDLSKESMVMGYYNGYYLDYKIENDLLYVYDPAEAIYKKIK